MPQAICAFCQVVTEHDDVTVLAKGIMQHMLNCEKHPVCKLTDLLIDTGVELGQVIEKCRAAAEVYREGGSVQGVIDMLDIIVAEAGPMLTHEEVAKLLEAKEPS